MHNRASSCGARQKRILHTEPEHLQPAVGVRREVREGTQIILRTGDEKTPVRRKIGIAELEQLDRSDFQRIALHVSADVHAKVIFLFRGFESFHDLCVPLRIELQELLVLRHDTKTTRRTLQCRVVKKLERLEMAWLSLGFCTGSLFERLLRPRNSAYNLACTKV